MLIIGDHLHKTMKHLTLEYCHHLCRCTVENVERDQVGEERARLQVRAQPQGHLFKAVRGREAQCVHVKGINTVNRACP